MTSKRIITLFLSIITILSLIGPVSGCNLDGQTPDQDKIISPPTPEEMLARRIENAGGTSSPYFFDGSLLTPAPEGYKPFFISHFGRHGSRCHTSVEMMESLVKTFSEAETSDILTPFGKVISKKVIDACGHMIPKAGELSEVGMNEHRGIAERMYNNYPEVFRAEKTGSPDIVAESTTSHRCILSMDSFTDRLKEMDSDISISKQADSKTSAYLNHYTKEYKEYYNNGPWKQIRDDWNKKNILPGRIIRSIFTSFDQFDGKPAGSRARRLVQNLYSLNAILPASGLDIRLNEVFNDEERLALWKSIDMDQYLRKGPSAVGGTLPESIALPLLKDFLSSGKSAVENPDKLDAKLRFGHGEGLMPLAALMDISDACKVESDPDKFYLAWQDFRISPMGGNIQWIFFRNKKGKVLVKILLNERESRIPVKTDNWPFYEWSKVYGYYMNLIKSY